MEQVGQVWLERGVRRACTLVILDLAACSRVLLINEVEQEVVIARCCYLVSCFGTDPLLFESRENVVSEG